MERIIFEMAPPPINWDESKVKAWIQEASSIIQSEKLLSITLPEIVDEVRESERTSQFIPKMDNLVFADLLKKENPFLIIIPNKITVRQPKDMFRDWVEKAYAKGIHHLVLVGGDHDSVDYPGFSVCDAARFIKERYPKIKLGGITIFDRDLEYERIRQKEEAGIEFFLSQILFDTAKMEETLLALKTPCPPIYLSLAYPSKPHDIELMQWLGVRFTNETLYTLSFEDNFEKNALLILERLLNDIFFFIDTHKINVGFNVEHLTYSNLDHSRTLYRILRDRIARD